MTDKRLLPALVALAERRGQRALRRHARAAEGHRRAECAAALCAEDEARTAQASADADTLRRANPASDSARCWHLHQAAQVSRAIVALEEAEYAVRQSAAELARLRQEVRLAETRADALREKLTQQRRQQRHLAEDRAEDDHPSPAGARQCR
ncbi:MAG: hypothetical protein ACKVOB_10435 [Sphingomonas sp.]